MTLFFFVQPHYNKNQFLFDKMVTMFFVVQLHYNKNQFLFDKMVTMFFLYNHIMTRTSFSLIRWWHSFLCTRAIYRMEYHCASSMKQQTPHRQCLFNLTNFSESELTNLYSYRLMLHCDQNHLSLSEYQQIPFL